MSAPGAFFSALKEASAALPHRVVSSHDWVILGF
jgi:hypothetical protein